ncbi:DNA-3-methyladenine glycosylase [Leptotrichia sp. OH3620_COT-345]|uniref:DNA-3-methyladenine glycosylase n=1 Tax=Leptotrichia sp. OH3620_COT-345 TaxID=2491048 RepID=UPI000F64ED7C|nr:DNA-3-methyladenine glycosylase [Leptotrichia sp. OH3620_COT-345]RRD40717.1 DNA-3-methyladenine glycosylase [Leptotrichia sp. OH3620_COT-345]
MKVNKEKNIFKDFFKQDTVTLAKSLLGKLLIVKSGENILSGYITETEAYLGIIDKACHSYKGKRTPKVEALYGKGGTVYIYTMHTHKMLNIVACEKGNPQAVLIRGIEPLDGLGIMETNRGKTGILVSNGPGKLTKAVGINDKFNMSEITVINRNENVQKINENILYIDFEMSKEPKKIMKSPRIGIPDKGIWTRKFLRFYVNGNKYVSGMKKGDFSEKCWKEKNYKIKFKKS